MWQPVNPLVQRQSPDRRSRVPSEIASGKILAYEGLLTISREYEFPIHLFIYWEQTFAFLLRGRHRESTLTHCVFCPSDFRVASAGQAISSEQSARQVAFVCGG
jgi:hypothetical protein